MLEEEWCFVRGGKGGGGLEGGGKGEGLVISLIWLIVSYIFVNGFGFFWDLCGFLDFLVDGMFILNLVSGFLIFSDGLFEWLVLVCVDLWVFVCVNDEDVIGLFVEFKLKVFCMGIFLFLFEFIFWVEVWFLDFEIKGFGFELGEFVCFVLVVVLVGDLDILFNELSDVFFVFGLEVDILSGLGSFVGKFVLDGV